MYDNNLQQSTTLPLIGDVAPEFTATTTNGQIKFPEDFRGHWVILFSHPMDFTPVCTTEFLSFQSMIKDFKELDTEIIGLSVGAIASHLAWFRSIHEEIKFNNLKNIDITFPVIADIDLHISKLYGMIHPNTSDTKTVRTVFIIDPKSIIRTILYYPQTTGRNIKEIKRILLALQTTDAFKVSTPADWLPGLPVIVPTPQNMKDLKQRLNNKDKSIDVQSWYLTFKELPEHTIFEKLKREKT